MLQISCESLHVRVLTTLLCLVWYAERFVAFLNVHARIMWTDILPSWDKCKYFQGGCDMLRNLMQELTLHLYIRFQLQIWTYK